MPKVFNLRPLARLVRVRPVVLVVDDDEDMRFILRKTLQRVDTLGRHRHRVAAGGLEALQIAMACAAEARALLVLSDQRMPDMDGLALAEALCPLRARIPLRFVLFTSLPDAAQMAATDGPGVDAVWEKPFSASEWVRRLRTILSPWEDLLDEALLADPLE